MVGKWENVIRHSMIWYFCGIIVQTNSLEQNMPTKACRLITDQQTTTRCLQVRLRECLENCQVKSSRDLTASSVQARCQFFAFRYSHVLICLQRVTFSLWETIYCIHVCASFVHWSKTCDCFSFSIDFSVAGDPVTEGRDWFYTFLQFLLWNLISQRQGNLLGWPENDVANGEVENAH